MISKKRVIATVLSGAFLYVTSAQALTQSQRCESGKLTQSAKYGLCRLKAESKGVKKGLPADFTKCEGKFTLKFNKAETKAGAGVCPSEMDEPAINTRITLHAADVATLLAGGALPICGDANVDVGEQCDGANLAGTNCPALGFTGGTLGCDGSCFFDLSACTTTDTACQSSLTTCQGDLGTCNGSLTTCNISLGVSQGDLGTCNGSLTTCNAGTATAANVLAGETFSSSAGLGVTGTMTNVGQQNVTPGTAAVTIGQGHHDGTGSVAGDVDLVAGNIKSGVNIFGVTGTAATGGLVPGTNPILPATGQTTAFGAGTDGAVQAGAALSYTDNGDGTITDNNTGLMWEKKDDNNAGGIHDMNNAYTWSTGSPWNLDGTLKSVFLDTLNDVAGGGANCFAGQCDWRIPNYKELTSILDLEVLSPAIDPAFHQSATCTGCSDVTSAACSCTASSFYWSSTTVAPTPSSAWGVNFGGGSAGGTSKSNGRQVRAVRGGL